MYTLPQEIEVWFIIPALRRDLAKCLVQKHGLSYDKVGKLLGITKAAISQYLKNKRATKIKLHKKIEMDICFSCEKIIHNKSDSVKEITKLLRKIRDKNLHCEVCGEVADGQLHDCEQIIPKYENL
jgi:uncharacterized protein